MFSSVLIANRGEISLRVQRTCRRLGIRTIAVCTDLDLDAPHVRDADEAVRVPSYLDVDAVVAAAIESGAEAIHPGYGFLSERSVFARAVEAAGLVLVGPSAEVMDLMGRKDAARELAIAAGVRVVPQGVLRDAARPSRPSGTEDATFPVLIKAAAGGGGKGMRIVRSSEEYADALASAKREALSAFGDDTILVERYVEHGRHIEVQVLADTHGNVVHLFERDCSAQRRHQKVLEESPAPTITAAIRDAVTSSAVALAKHVGYTNAGTVEFLLDADSGEAYFLEMNTRLQVEHPVTELAVQIGGQGLDLVELQLRVAAGEPLPFAQADVTQAGHAIEARVYAEDSWNDFLPQAGTASIVRWPQDVRVDHALASGQVVSTAYDPMLGKVVAHGPDREYARRALVDALDDTAILGLTTNVGFVRSLAASKEFRDAAIDTAWLDALPEHGGDLEPPSPDTARIFAAWTQAMLTAISSDNHPFQADGWRLGAPPAPQLVELDRLVTVDRAAGIVDQTPVTELSADNHVLVLLLAGRHERAVVNATAHAVDVVIEGQRFVFARPDVMTDHGPPVGDGTVIAPMPGTVLDVRVAAGDVVQAGQVLGVVEAMKMELTLKAPFDGAVAAVAAIIGEQVALGETLFLIEPAAVEAAE
jgi:acetyl-CoA/propionyl-CoA carboxylase, biotin carboxylase, biotin carboxyl carrier protein